MTRFALFIMNQIIFKDATVGMLFMVCGWISCHNVNNDGVL